MNRWDDASVESMYDKTLLGLETGNLLSWVSLGDVVCDVGCGEGEGTLAYSGVGGVSVLAVDNSPVRLEMARKRLAGRRNVEFRLASAADDLFWQLVASDHCFDTVISQRMLINLPDWEEQKRALTRLASIVPVGGQILLSEGSMNGVRCLNGFREKMGLGPIPVPSHNVFIEDAELIKFAAESGWKFVDAKTIGTYSLLTRGVQPALTDGIDWRSDFNQRSAGVEIFGAAEFSRIKQWKFRR